MLIDVAVVIMALTLVVLAAYLVPVFVELRKTAAVLRDFIVETENELTPVLHEIREALAELKGITGIATDKADEVKSFMDALGNTGKNLRTINSVVGAVAGVLASSSAWITGARAAGTFLLDRLSKKRRRE
jgi:uncharacterized protein YoxC